MPEDIGGLQKLKIIGFKEDPSTPQASGGSKEFSTQINPSKVSHRKAVLFNSNNTNNSTSKDVKQYQGMDQDELEFELMFENTSLYHIEDSGGGSAKTVQALVKELQEVCVQYQGSIHKPYYLVINWGDFGFKGHLKEMNVEYNLFETNGEPSRAVINLLFVGHEDFESAARNANNQSPDMTHVKTIVDGDHLPLMCQDVYDDMNHFIQIAEINGLTNFRKLNMGEHLVFPPVE